MSVHFGAPAGSQRWPHSMLWKLGSFIFLILLKRIDCLANPSYLPDNNNPSVNIYMSLEEVKKFLGKDDAGFLWPEVHCLNSALRSFSVNFRQHVSLIVRHIHFDYDLYQSISHWFFMICLINRRKQWAQIYTATVVSSLRSSFVMIFFKIRATNGHT